MNENFKLDDLEVKISPAPASDPPRVEPWKKVLLVGVVLLVYAGLVVMFVCGHGGVKLAGLLLLVLYTFLVKPFVRVLRRVLKFPPLPD